jgi:hypothetical protein
VSVTRAAGPAIAIYASGHGFGHAARMSALLEVLQPTLGDDFALHVRSDAPTWLFQETAPEVIVHPVAADPGILQRNALDVDLHATVEAHRSHLEAWPSLLERESGWLRETGVVLVIADVSPLACAAAARAEIPAVAVSNFGWDWILEPYCAEAPELETAVERYGQAYAGAECLYRLPLHGFLPTFEPVVEVPHLVRPSRLEAAEVRQRLGLSSEDDRPLVLVSFGGFSRDTLVKAGGAESGLRDFVFAGFAERPEGFQGTWHALPHPSPISHPDLVAAADVVIGKAGYSTVAEVLAQRTRFLHVPRPDWAEAAILTAGLERDGCTLPIGRHDFFACRWRTPLEAILAKPLPPEAPPCNGAATITRAIERRLPT